MRRYGAFGFPAGQTVGLRATERVGGVNGTLSPVETNTWPSEADPSVQAHVIVQTEVINPAVAPVTASIGQFGNGYRFINRDGGFEPTVFRTKFAALSGGANSLELMQDDATNYNSWAEGLFNGGSIRVMRMVSGTMTLIREGTISAYRASGWQSKLDTNRVTTATTFRVKFDNWNKPSATQWFSVATVNSAGDVSAKSTAVTYTTPATITSTTDPTNTIATKTLTGATAGTAPTGLAATAVGDGSQVELTWNAVGGAAGYIVYMSDHNPASHQGYGITLVNDGGAAILAGDMIIVSKKFYAPTRAQVLHNRVWGLNAGFFNLFSIDLIRRGSEVIRPGEDATVTYELVAHSSTKPFPDAGETFLRLTLNGSSNIRVGAFCHGSLNQTGDFDYYPVLEPSKTYRVRVKMKADAPRTVTFDPEMILQNGGLQGTTTNFSVTTSWQEFTWTFSPNELFTNGGGIGFMGLKFPTTGVFDIDQYQVYEDGKEYLELGAQWPARLAVSGVDMLRTHAFIKTQQQTYDLEQFTNPAGAIAAVTGGNTLPQTLALVRDAGASPWLQFEMHFSPAEILGLVEYLAGTSGAWADKRIAQGQTAPWTDVFPKFFIEVSNETWNLLFRPWVFTGMIDSVTAANYSGGTIYGKFMRWVIGVMKTSPHWTPALESKIKFVLGGWGITGNSFSSDAAAACPEAHFVTVAAYNGGWESGAAIPVPGVGSSYRNTLTYTVQGAEPAIDSLVAGANGLKAGTYEAGPGYLLNGLNGATVTTDDSKGQERVMKSVSAGVATLDVFLQNMQKGLAVQNYFTLSEGQRWTSHAASYWGGGTFPAWQAMSLFNVQAGGGNMLRTRVLWKPTTDLPAIINPVNSQTVYPAKAGASDIAAYAFRKGSKVIIFLISRLIPFNALQVSDPLYNASDDGKRTFWVKAPIKSATSLKLYRFDQGYDQHNVTAPTGADTRAAVITTTETTLSVPAKPGEWVLDASMGASGGLPPASVYAYVFDGVP